MNASSIFTKDDVLVEVACERNGKCDTDQRAYKSGAIRSYARAALVAPFIADSVHTLIEASAKGAAKSCEADSQDVKCNLEWTGSPKLDTKSASDGNLGEVTNALSAVKALLWSSAKPFTPSAGSLGSNSTNGTGASGNSGAAAPENTGAAGTIAASAASALIVAFAAALVL
jgi:mannan endo-1,6-alpha-mannosidase